MRLACDPGSFLGWHTKNHNHEARVRSTSEPHREDVSNILPAPLHYRELQNLKNTILKCSLSHESVEVTLDEAAKQDLLWWQEEARR